jgi:hypothetical protein
MILYLFKSTIGLLILWGIYKLFLEPEKLHVFNRCYLLLSLVFAFIVPAISIELASTKAENNLVALKKTIEINPEILKVANPAKLSPIEVQKRMLWSDYVVIFSSLISLVLLIRFLNNLTIIFKSTQTNPKIKWQSAKLVLLDKQILPYTFLNYIFISREYYENAHIEPELFSHELAHVRQKHSLDVIFIELLRIIFWFNPLLYLFKQAIQLNHEFLADEAVNKTYHNVPAYQYLLLSKAAQTSGLTFTSNLNFQITKKRLLMMTKITSDSTAFIRKAAIVPLFVALAFCLADVQSMAQEPTKLKLSSPPTITLALKPHKLTWEDVNYQNAKVLIRGDKGLPIHKKYSELTEEEKNKNLQVLYSEKSSPTQEVMNKWKDAKMYGVWLNEKRIRNSELSKYKPSDIADFWTSKLEKNAINYGKHYYQVGLMTHDYYDNVYMKQVKESPTLYIEEIKIKKQ